MTAGYSDQFLMIEARTAVPDAGYFDPEAAQVHASARVFGAAATEILDTWRARFSTLPGRAAIWGAGSKGITFANALGPDGGPLAALVDLNTRKHGLFAPGVGLPVVSPDELKGIDLDFLLIANAIYEREISDQVRSLGLAAEVAVMAG